MFPLLYPPEWLRRSLASCSHGKEWISALSNTGVEEFYPCPVIGIGIVVGRVWWIKSPRDGFSSFRGIFKSSTDPTMDRMVLPVAVLPFDQRAILLMTIGSSRVGLRHRKPMEGFNPTGALAVWCFHRSGTISTYTCGEDSIPMATVGSCFSVTSCRSLIRSPCFLGSWVLFPHSQKHPAVDFLTPQWQTTSSSKIEQSTKRDVQRSTFLSSSSTVVAAVVTGAVAVAKAHTACNETERFQVVH